MFYESDQGSLGVKIVYLENVRYSIASLLHAEGKKRKSSLKICVAINKEKCHVA